MNMLQKIAILAESLQSLAATSAIWQRRYIEEHGCQADIDCPNHPLGNGLPMTWERHIARIALELAELKPDPTKRNVQ